MSSRVSVHRVIKCLGSICLWGKCQGVYVRGVLSCHPIGYDYVRSYKGILLY